VHRKSKIPSITQEPGVSPGCYLAMITTTSLGVMFYGVFNGEVIVSISHGIPPRVRHNCYLLRNCE